MREHEDAADKSIESPSETQKTKIQQEEKEPTDTQTANDQSVSDDIGESTPQVDLVKEDNNVESTKSKKAAGEVFQELKSVVVGMDIKLDEIGRFVQIAKDKLIQQADEYELEGKLKVIESLFELHDRLFRRVISMEAGSLEPDSFCIELMRFVQEILQKHGIDVIIPQPGDPFDMNYMESLRALPAKFWRISDTVANVEKCGYSISTSQSEEKVLRPARVNVYRKPKK